MKILIIENEVYLAQSIATKFSDLGHICETCTSARDALKHNDFDVVLLSTSLNSNDLTPVVENFKDAIVILMVSYISNDTVSKPLSAGAKDYILKPFMLEELVRKIDHYRDYERLKKFSKMVERYFNHTFTQNIEYPFENFSLPLFIYSSVQKSADSFAYNFAKTRDTIFYFIDLSNSHAFEEIENANETALLYAINYQTLKKGEKKDLFALIENKQIIIATSEKPEDEIPYKTIELSNENSFFTQGDILPIEDYVKYVVINYQHKYPDTELSKKLGISRKSLWEKRKKYDIIKKK